MRWEDERYVRVYTRDTGDWLALSFEAQALFLMLLRKVDRIGELHLGRRGPDAVPALLGHADKAERLGPALSDLLADGCVRLSDDGTRLFVPNFLKAQEAAKSPAERKREQRERDAAQALEKTQLSRNVTPVTSSHEMSPRAVPSRAVPPEPSMPPVPVSLPDADAPAVGATGELELAFKRVPPSRRQGEKKPKKAEEPEAPGWQDLVGSLFVAYKADRNVDPKPSDRDWAALKRLRKRVGDDAEILRRFMVGLRGQFKQQVDCFFDLDQRWDALTRSNDTGPPRDVRKAPVRAEDTPREAFNEQHPF